MKAPNPINNQNSTTPQKKESKLSLIRRRGPANPQGKIYLRTENSIRRAICVGLSRRYLGLQARTVFRTARITAPAFYSHAENVNSALINYETSLERELVEALPKSPKREMAWTILLHFISRNRDYFRATFKTHNLYLISRLINHMRYILVGTGDVSDKSYAIYTANAIGVIQCWANYDHFDKDLIDYYVKKLMQIRFMRF